MASRQDITAGPLRRRLPVYLSCFGYGVQAGAAMPLVPLALQHRGVDNVTIGLVEAAWGVGMISPPIAGSALQFIGRPGFGLSLAVFYAIAGVGALLALRRSG